MTFKSSKGLTIAELIIGLAVLVILGLISSLYLINVRRNRALYADVYTVVAVLREAQQRAITQDVIAPGEHWGVHFDNTSNTRPYFELFKELKGDEYPGQTYSKFIPKSLVTFCNPIQGTAKDIFFDNITGLPTDIDGVPLSSKEFINLKLRGSPREYVEISIDIQGDIIHTDHQDC